MSGDAWQEGLSLFRDGRWFEAHEVLEGAWRATPPGPRRELLQGLIQLAVSLEHWRRQNPRGAWGQWTKARARLVPLPATVDGLALGELLADFERYWDAVGLLDALHADGWDLSAGVPVRVRPPVPARALATAPPPVPRWS